MKSQATNKLAEQLPFFHTHAYCYYAIILFITCEQGYPVEKPQHYTSCRRLKGHCIMHLVENSPHSETSQESASAPSVTIANIWQAHKFLKPLIHHTPLSRSRTLSQMTGADIYLKCEHMQRSGAFKVRGAGFKISRLTTEQGRAGVIAASAGNHA